MAFNFNWSPLAADASFYQRAREMLTTALNKSPKPPIIVDDIIVTEFNLGSVPPDLEILEIGDIAADRFRGIFKMCYTGDAFLTLKTRVQVSTLGIAISSFSSSSAFSCLLLVLFFFSPPFIPPLSSPCSSALRDNIMYMQDKDAGGPMLRDNASSQLGPAVLSAQASRPTCSRSSTQFTRPLLPCFCSTFADFSQHSRGLFPLPFPSSPPTTNQVLCRSARYDTRRLHLTGILGILLFVSNFVFAFLWIYPLFCAEMAPCVISFPSPPANTIPFQIAIGQSTQHIPLLQAVLYITRAPRSRLGPHHSTPNHTLRNQTLRFHYCCFLKTKGSHISLPQ